MRRETSEYFRPPTHSKEQAITWPSLAASTELLLPDIFPWVTVQWSFRQMLARFDINQIQKFKLSQFRTRNTHFQGQTRKWRKGKIFSN